MAQSTVKNKKYSTSKKALGEKIKELEFRNFELERTLQSIVQLINLAMIPKPTSNSALASLNNLNVSQDILNQIRQENFAFKKFEETQEEETKPVKKKTERPVAEQTGSDAEHIKEKQTSYDASDSKIEEVPVVKPAPELTPEQKEIERKKRLAGSANPSKDDLKASVAEETVRHAQVLKEMGQQSNYLKCSICETTEDVGYSDKLQKAYCVKCLQKASIKIR